MEHDTFMDDLFDYEILTESSSDRWTTFSSTDLEVKFIYSI